MKTSMSIDQKVEMGVMSAVQRDRSGGNCKHKWDSILDWSTSKVGWCRKCGTVRVGRRSAKKGPWKYRYREPKK